MSEDQVTVILKAISDARQESSTAIGALSTNVAKFQGNIEARVVNVEEDMKSEKKWGRIKVALVPAYALLHAGAAHLGIKV